MTRENPNTTRAAARMPRTGNSNGCMSDRRSSRLYSPSSEARSDQDCTVHSMTAAASTAAPAQTIQRSKTMPRTSSTAPKAPMAGKRLADTRGPRPTVLVPSGRPSG